jgi:hypothetical protein
MSNATENIAYLTVIALSIIIFAAVVLAIWTNTLNKLNTYVPSSSFVTDIKNDLQSGMNFLKDGFHFIVILLVSYAIYSALINRQTLEEYLVGFVTSIIAGGLVMWVINAIYTRTSTDIATNWADITWFFQNINIIVLAVITAGLLSFIFSRRSE